MFPFSKERRHPAVIISNDETCQNPDIEEVNALLCTSAKVSRSAKSTEETLDEADGLDWKTLVRCDKIHLLPKARFTQSIRIRPLPGGGESFFASDPQQIQRKAAIVCVKHR